MRFWEETTTTQVNNPISKYLNYKEGAFVTYDKDKWENAAVPLKEFIVLNVGYKIIWRSEKYHARIFSNESQSFRWPFTVKESKDKTVLFSWEYSKDTKQSILDAGGKFALSITVVENNELYNITLSWAASKEFSDFMRLMGDKVNTHKVKFTGSKDAKKWAVQYHLPVFAMGTKLDELEIEFAKSKVDALYNSDSSDD